MPQLFVATRGQSPGNRVRPRIGVAGKQQDLVELTKVRQGRGNDGMAGRKIFVHINNTNPVLLDDTAERAAAERAGWEIAYDGMEIAL